MLNLAGLLSKVELSAVVTTLFEGWELGQNVSCPFAETKHQKGTDTSKSMSISADGKAFCHACGYKATSILNLYNDMYGYAFKEGANHFYNDFVEPIVPTEFVDAAHATLLKSPAILAMLESKRGIKINVVNQFRLGWYSGRLIIPILNDTGFYVNTRKYDLLKNSSIKMLPYAKGYGKARLFPIQALDKKQIYIFEGEPDTLLAIQHGLNAITATTGGLTWTDEMAQQFKDKDVILVPDLDETGLKSLAKRASMLSLYASSVSSILLPLKKTEGKDFTDFMLKHKDIKAFYSLEVKTYKGTLLPAKAEALPVDLLTFTPTSAESLHLERPNALFSYMQAKGAFFKNQFGELFYSRKDGNILRVLTSDSQFLGFLCSISPLLNTSTSSGRFILQHIINSAQSLCVFSKSASWSILQGNDLFMYGRQGMLVHFNEGKKEFIPNAINKYNLLLECPPQALPFDCREDKVHIGMQHLQESFMSNLAVSDEDKYLFLCWAVGIFFRVRLKNKPLFRLAASSAFGKSTASKMLSMLFYGEDLMHHSASTIASMYSLAAKYPLLIFDNIETRNMTQALEDFFIVAATGGMKSKRMMSTDSSVIFENIDSLVLTNGIEPFNKHEILNRTLEVNLNIDRYGKRHFHELKVVEELKTQRGSILYALAYIVSKKIIPRFQAGEAQRIARHFDSHSKERFNEYFGLMAIILDAVWPYMPLKNYALPKDLVNYWISAQNVTSKVSDEGTNEILYFLDTYVRRRNRLIDADVSVIEKDGIVTIRGTTRDLLSDFRILAKHLSMKCPWQNDRQLGARLADASEILSKAGWGRKVKISNGRKVYEYIKKVGV